MSSDHKIYYTLTDEAPLLATYAFLPIIRRFTDPAGVAIEKSDISVAARILAHFPEKLKPGQQMPDNLAALGKISLKPEANIIKLPNISASIPQLYEAIEELQKKGYDVPSFPQVPKNDAEHEIHARYAKVLGSAVNPVLREGNSDRRVALPVKAHAMKHPKKLGAWASDSKTHVSHMTDGDFYGSEKSYVMPESGSIKFEFVASDGSVKELRKPLQLQAKEVIDASMMSAKKFSAFVEEQIADAKAKGILFSLHMKATMMKVSDPVMFGNVVRVFYKDVFDKHKDTFDKIGVNPNNGIGDVYDKIKSLPEAQRKEIESDLMKQYQSRPDVAMVDSRKGITNLHVPSDVIIDASMPVVIRDSGKMWNKEDKLQDTKCVIPDRCYATIYAEMIDYCKKNGQFDPSKMGSVSNVGLMAQKAEEYGSHDKTFIMQNSGKIRITDDKGKVIFEHAVEKGDIWRMCQTKDAPIKDWVKLAVNRARDSNSPAIFWLDEARAHDRVLIDKVKEYLKEHDTKGLDIRIEKPTVAIKMTMERSTAGKDTISVTGNVLRDYLTDLFPILELGTSAKMLSIVPLLAGGGLYETGAGGSAPKHVQQFVDEGHLRWDSLGEYLALACSLEDIGNKSKNVKAVNLSKALNTAVGALLEKNLSPSRKVNEIDNRGSTFYVALFWAQAMKQYDPSFGELADALAAHESQIMEDLIKCQGKAVDIGGYYKPTDALAEKAMRPSETLNKIIGKSF